MFPKNLNSVDRSTADAINVRVGFDWRALGMGLGAAFAGALLWLDVAGLRTLLTHSNAEWVGGAAFVILFALTFGGVVAASAAIGADDDDEPRGGKRALAYAAARAR